MRAHAKASIGDAGPVADVVPAFPARQRPVRDFVMIVSAGLKRRFRKRVELGELALVGNARRQLCPGTALLVIEHVNRDVLRF